MQEGRGWIGLNDWFCWVASMFATNQPLGHSSARYASDLHGSIQRQAIALTRFRE